MWLQRKNKNRANLGSRTRTKILSASNVTTRVQEQEQEPSIVVESRQSNKNINPIRIETLSPWQNPVRIETLPPRQNSIRIENLSLRKSCPHQIRQCPCPHRNPVPAKILSASKPFPRDKNSDPRAYTTATRRFMQANNILFGFRICSPSCVHGDSSLKYIVWLYLICIFGDVLAQI